LIAGCGFESHRIDLGGEGPQETTSRGGGDLKVSALCSKNQVENEVPDTLECTGLYENIANKRLASAARSYVPAAPLWSDGAEKHRWIYLPPKTTIDTSDANHWRFPVGTKVWKEFKIDGKRVETRLYQKVRSDRWLRGTYAWNDDETQAEFTFGGDVPLGDGTYHIPTQDECNDCHEGQVDRLLGFDAISLGLPGATGITLSMLVDEGLLSDPPENPELSIGDDGTGLAAQALPILHINCGVSCHNDSPDATANLASQNLRLDATQLDGRTPDDSWSMLKSTLGQHVDTIQWQGAVRIAPGDPDNSLVVKLMSTRTASGDGQMPPIATRRVDDDAVSVIREWISKLPAADER
jgi:hypothetical protein